MEIDYAEAWTFIDPADGLPRKMRYRRTGGDIDTFKSTGQLIAVVADGHRDDNGDTIYLSRDGIPFEHIELALDGWELWAKITDRSINLATIRRRIQTAGLG